MKVTSRSGVRDPGSGSASIGICASLAQPRERCRVAAFERDRERGEPLAVRAEPDHQRVRRVRRGPVRLEQQLDALLRDQLAQVADDRPARPGEPAEPRRRVGFGHRLVVGLGERVERGRVPILERSLHPRVDRRRAAARGVGIAVEQLGRFEQRLGPRSRPERGDLHTGRHDPREILDPRDQGRASREHVGGRPDDGARGLEPFARQLAVPLLDPHRVLEVAAVDLRDVSTGTERAPTDRGAGDRVTGERDLGPVPPGGRAQRVDVRVQVRTEVVIGQVDEPDDLVEPLVPVQDEDRDHRADPRAQQDAPPGRAPHRLRRQLRRPVGVDRPERVDPRVPFGMLLLTQQQHVVTGGAVVLGHARGRDVGPRTLQEPPVPQQDARHRCSTSAFDRSGFDTLAVQPRCGSLSWEGS